MNRKLTLAAMVCATMAVASGTAFAQKSHSKKRSTEMTYTGCVEPGKQAGTYQLTHVMAGKPGETASSSEQGQAQAPEMIMLSSKSVKLAQMSGHKVTVMGTTRKQKNETTMRVRSAESLSGSCP